MLPLTRACVIAVALALLIPGVARAIPITFEFSGIVNKTGGFPNMAEGDPLAATLRYDTDVWFKVDDDGDHIVYTGEGRFNFEVRVGTYSFSAYPILQVWTAGDRLQIGLRSFGDVFFEVEGPGLVPPGGGAPTSFNFAAVTSYTLWAGDLEHTLDGELTSVVQTQGPDLITTPEPATLTLSAFGLAALLARRRHTRATRVWHAGGEVFHATTQTRP